MLDDVPEVHTVSIIRSLSLSTLMMEAVHTSETSVNIYLTTWQYIPQDSKLHKPEIFNIPSLDILVYLEGERAHVSRTQEQMCEGLD
jgi:hypothetical protein